MKIASIKEKLHNFVDTADEKQLADLYLFIENEFAEKYDWWEDKALVAEMDQRVKDFESGKTKGISWEEVKSKARLRLTEQQDGIENQTDKNKKMDLIKQAVSDPLFLADMKEIDDDFRTT